MLSQCRRTEGKGKRGKMQGSERRMTHRIEGGKEMKRWMRTGTESNPSLARRFKATAQSKMHGGCWSYFKVTMTSDPWLAVIYHSKPCPAPSSPKSALQSANISYWFYRLEACNLQQSVGYILLGVPSLLSSASSLPHFLFCFPSGMAMSFVKGLEEKKMAEVGMLVERCYMFQPEGVLTLPSSSLNKYIFKY